MIQNTKKADFDDLTIVGIANLNFKLTNMNLVLLYWIVIARFKIVEVQVVSDEHEITYNIFRKLNALTSYFSLFMASFLNFNVTLTICNMVQEHNLIQIM